jgi:hypothetical protein
MPVRPTVINPSMICAQPSTPPIVAVTTPSAIAGVARKTLNIPPRELVEAFPGTSSETLIHALRVLNGIIPDTLTDAQCARWGEETQRRFGELTQKSLLLATSKSVEDATRNIKRLFDLLRELNTAFEPQRRGILQGLWGKTDDPWTAYREHEREMQQLCALLDHTALAELQHVVSESASLAAEFETLAVNVMAESLAARYLAEKILDPRQRVAAITALDNRSNALLETVAHVQHGAIVRDQSMGELRRLISCVQDVVLNTLPAWIEAVTYVLRKRTPTQTDVATARTELQRMVELLARN